MEVTVYILRCSDGSYYTGLTKQNIEARLWEHNAGTYDGYTAKRRPVELVFTESYDRIIDAIGRERQIKGWNRQKKEALIAYAYEVLPNLSHRGPVKRLSSHPTRPRPEVPLRSRGLEGSRRQIPPPSNIHQIP
ncbi:putative endonuclease [Rhizobium sp. RU33A]|nr:putative endonuclease [Rhizobium sp. RU33A]